MFTTSFRRPRPLVRIAVATLLAATCAATHADDDAALDPAFGDGAGFRRYAPTLEGQRRQAQPPFLFRRSDGDLLLVGVSRGVGADRLEMRRLTRDGAPVATFGQQGVVQVPSPVGSVRAVALGRDDEVFVVGFVENATEGVLGGDVHVARYDGAGIRDLGFGVGGVARADFAGVEPGFVGDEPAAAVVDARGGLVVVGTSTRSTGTVASAIGVTRLFRNGSLDTTFAPPLGRRLVHFPFATIDQATAGAVALDPRDGGIYVGGTMQLPAGSPNRNDIVLAKLTSEGQLDTTFCPPEDVPALCTSHPGIHGGRRALIHAVANTSNFDDRVGAVFVDAATDTVFIAGSLPPTDANTAILRRSAAVLAARTSDGRDRPALKPRVELVAPPGTFSSQVSTLTGIARDPQGRLVFTGAFVAARAAGGGEQHALLLRRTLDNAVDTSFSRPTPPEAIPGHVYYTIPDTGPVAFTRGSAVLMDGARIVFAGPADAVAAGAVDFYVARLLGAEDALFSNGFE